MNVYLDAQPLLGARSGIARYTECLSKELSKDVSIDLFLAFNRIAKSIREDHVLEIERDFHLHLINSIYPYKVIRRLCEPNFLYNLPYDILTKSKADIFHGTNFTLTPTLKAKNIITIHDLAYMRYPEATSDRILKHHSKWVPYSAQKCDRIIADSQQTKQDIIELLSIHQDKIDVVHLAADESFQYVQHTAPIIEKYQLPEKFILFVGTLEPRKNLLGLLKAFSLLKKNFGCSEKLVIVGAKGWKFTPIFDWVQEHHLEEEVIFTGFIDDEDLPGLYSAASVFVMPSIYEGFGLPLLEAMQCRTPVIGSNVSSIPEIIGEAGMLLPPEDSTAWAEGIYKMVSDAAVRECYSQLALERSKLFTWDKTAAETKKVYEKALGHK
ncbi:glycosyltransferase family 4 protein [Paenibacillus radicis (ex Xue et al. 2023)]|uniref:Glycosyltransferase family 4 protein n=1 Tax=Paenibacillus radicis (ex Xue et al. 2023) TaxID=2972489 RepID=A0ABT1YUA7_9BACL|nr:glycosyltransferase family 1 protein [Paenibacillus radicis (ex Xue et al. 2023)]MCR8635969.1 glycosyltransferase family 4 protein [Paenibacillus radicis (ex Xue et al. 2023)]